MDQRPVSGKPPSGPPRPGEGLIAPTLDEWAAMGRGERERFIQAVLAAHSDPALAMAEGRPHKRAKNAALDELGLHFGSTGRTIYLADALAGRVYSITATRERGTTWGYLPYRFVDPFGVALDRTGDIYVADAGHDHIVKFSPGGRVLKVLGQRGLSPGHLNFPTDVAIDPEGNIIVMDSGNSRIQELSPSGRSLGQWGARGSGDGRLYLPWGLALSRDGTVFIADSGNNRIQTVSLRSSGWLPW